MGSISVNNLGLLRHRTDNDPVNRPGIMEPWRNNGRRGHTRARVLSLQPRTSRSVNDLRYNRSLACVPAIGAVLQWDWRSSRDDSTSRILLNHKRLF